MKYDDDHVMLYLEPGDCPWHIREAGYFTRAEVREIEKVVDEAEALYFEGNGVVH